MRLTLARNLTVLLPLVVTLTACGGSNETKEPSATPVSATRATQGVVAKKGRHAELLGRWSPTLPPREARAVVTARAALADPPNDAAFEAMGPSEDDRASYRNLIRLRLVDEHSPQVVKVRRTLAEYEEMLVEVTPTSIGWRTPGAREERHEYRALAEDGDVVTIGAKDEQYDVRFLDKDHISMRGTTRTFLLTRDSAVAADAATPQAAWNGATGRPGREGGPRRATGAGAGAVIPGPGAPPSTGGPRDACTAYADCIDQMPRFSNDGGGMSASSSTIRNWEKTPDRLRQCAAAHEMARAGTLCR